MRIPQLKLPGHSRGGRFEQPRRNVGPDGEEALTADLREYLDGQNVAGEGTLVLEPEYLQVIGTKR